MWSQVGKPVYPAFRFCWLPVVPSAIKKGQQFMMVLQLPFPLSKPHGRGEHSWHYQIHQTCIWVTALPQKSVGTAPGELRSALYVPPLPLASHHTTLAPNKQLPKGAREGLLPASYSSEHVSPPWLNACFSFMAPSSLISIRNSLIMFFSLPNLCSLILSTRISTLYHGDLESDFSKAFKHLIHNDFYQLWHGQFL